VLDRLPAACAEFPNENPALHLGAIWLCLDVCGEVTCERPAESELEHEAPWDPEEDDGDIEIVDDLGFDDPVGESIAPPVPAPEDPFLSLVAILEDVARASGAGEDALSTLRALLGQQRIEAAATDDHRRLRSAALAWQGILRGESEDFAACGPATLDEWGAAVVATALGAHARAELIKRELRRRGVAAFGLVDRAA